MNIKIEENGLDKNSNVKCFMVKGEKGEQGDLNKSHIVNDLISTDTNKVLSAKQGKVLKDLVDANKDDTDTQIKVLDDNLSAEIEETNTNLEKNYATKATIQSLASGSPKGVYANSDSIKTANPETGIYVTTDDGHIYSWTKNGTDVTDLGVYQASELADKSVIFNKLSKELQNSFQYNFSETNYIDKLKKQYFINTAGEERQNVNAGYYSIDVEYGEEYYLNIFYTNALYSNNNNVYFILDKDNKIIAFKKITEALEDNRFIKQISIPKYGSKLLINCSSANGGNGSYILKISDYYQKKSIDYKQFDDKLKAIFKETYTESQDNLTTVVENAYYQGFQFAVAGNYKVKQLTVKPGEKYKITTYAFYNQNSIFISLKDCTYTTTVNDTTYTLNNTFKGLRPQESNQTWTYELIVPAYCDKIYINEAPKHPIQIEKVNDVKVNGEAIDVDFNQFVRNPFNNKTILFAGDSITYGAGERPESEDYSQTGWVLRIKNNNQTAKVFGYGVGGSTIAKRDNRSDDICSRINKMYEQHSEADYIILQGGVNDAYNPTTIALGEISNGYDAELNENTFCGAFESMLKKSITFWKGKKIGYIVTFKVPSAIRLGNYMDLAKQMCEKWSIPYLDLYNNSGLCYALDEIKQEFSKGDGLHPNTAGYDLITPKIEQWMKSL